MVLMWLLACGGGEPAKAPPEPAVLWKGAPWSLRIAGKRVTLTDDGDPHHRYEIEGRLKGRTPTGGGKAERLDLQIVRIRDVDKKSTPEDWSDAPSHAIEGVEIRAGRAAAVHLMGADTDAPKLCVAKTCQAVVREAR